MIRSLPDLADSYDVIVAGSGAAGMSAALFAAIKGARVLLLERTEHLGGTTALSAATTWIPNSDHAGEVSDGDSAERAEAFLSAVTGNHGNRTMLRAFLEAGPSAVRLLEARSDVRFRPYATHPDYEQQHEGATLRGRALEPLPFDGRRLGPVLDLIRPPIPEFTLFGGMMVDRTDIGHLLKLRRNGASFRHAAGILGRYGLDRLTGRRRGSRLVMGNALVGRMLSSLLGRNVDIALRAETSELHAAKGRVCGLTVTSGSHSRRLSADKALVLAGGGFNRGPRRESLLPAGMATHSPAAPGHTGYLQDLAVSLGARFADGGQDSAFWAPVSVRTRADGTTAVFPHFVLDRSKPGTLCVNQRGERFTNESASYHLFARAMMEASKASPAVPCFIIADARALDAYGLGMVRMRTGNLSPFLADGYLTDGATIGELAGRLGMDPDTLTATVERFNALAGEGVDPDFGRGATAYHRANGDAAYSGRNPCLGPLIQPPFYAVRLKPGDIGASAGLAIGPDAEVLRDDGSAIGGLYACGNEARSIMGGTYPGPGITIGPAITFAYRAMAHAFDEAT